MPVSNPSAFPPPRAGDQIISINGGTNHVGGSVFIAGQSAGDNSTIGDLILIGTNVGSQGWTTAGMEGTVAIGSQALAAYPDQAQGSTPAASTVIGGFAAQVLLSGFRNVIIGDHAMQNTGGSNAGDGAIDNVVIGSQAGQNAGTGGARIDQSVIVGSQAVIGASNVENCVLIGALVGVSAENLISNCIVIGALAAESAFGHAQAQANVIIIGNGSDGPPTGQGVYIGNSIVGINGGNNVVVGTSAVPPASRSVVIGDVASGLGATSAVVIGSAAAVWEPGGGVTDRLIIEVGDGQTSPNRRLIYGGFDTGNIALGQTPPGTVFPSGATNAILLPNGSRGPAGVNPNGYFYVDSLSGLHFVGTSGTDTTLAPQ